MNQSKVDWLLRSLERPTESACRKVSAWIEHGKLTGKQRRLLAAALNLAETKLEGAEHGRQARGR